MATLTYDGRSFMVDGRRIWLVSGSIHHTRIPSGEWADRIHAAKLAGLNTIETTVFWNQVEPRSGHFDFSGQADVRRFIELVGEAGMMCILRAGPYSGSGWDLGGLPHWLVADEAAKVRGGGAVFLEACSRYITKLAEQVVDLQATAPGEAGGGPIVLLEQERAWTCGDATIRAGYLDELGRYFREAGFKVPVVNTNELWQSVEGQIDGWRGEAGLFGSIRQLAAVKPDQPRIVMDFPNPRPVPLGVEGPEPAEPLTLQRRLAEAYAAGAQVNLTPFATGTTFGFWPGLALSSNASASVLSSTQDSGGMVAESGAPTEAFGPIRRLTSFASAFGRVLAAAQDDVKPIVTDPDDPAATSVIHTSGTQGGVAWVFAREDASRAKRGFDVINLILSDGSSLDVPVGEQGVVWCALDVHLGGRATLTRSSFCVLDSGHGMLVCFGPTGAVGEVCINGTPLRVEAPKAGQVYAERFEGITVVVVSESTADHTFLTESGVYVGVHGVTPEGDPVPVPGSTKKFHVVSPEGDIGHKSPGKAASATPKASLGSWSCVPMVEHATGESPRFATIDGPSDLATLGVARGYGWYRIEVKVGAAKKYRLAAPGCGDRVQLFVDGAPAGVLGPGPGGSPEVGIQFKRGQRVITAIAENAGRLSAGSSLYTRKGLFRELCEVTPYKLGKATVAEDEPLDPLALTGVALMHVHAGDATSPYRVRWAFSHRKKSTIAATSGPAPTPGLILLNGEVMRFVDQGATANLWLDAETTHRGNNTLDFAPLLDAAADEGPATAETLAVELDRVMRTQEVVSELSAKGVWAFAKWEQPADDAFEPVSKTAMASDESAVPAWWKTTFDAEPESDHPLVLTLNGMRKGQIYINGEHLRRYYLADDAGDTAVTIPPSWLRAEGNELVLFDEHGGSPEKVKLSYDASARRYVGADAGASDDEA